MSLRRDPADLRSVLPRRPEIAASVFLNINATGRMSDGHDAGDTAALYSANDGVLSDEAVAEELGLISWLIERRPDDAEELSASIVEAAETCQRVFQSIGANTSPSLVAKVSVAAYQLSVLVGRGGDWRHAISFALKSAELAAAANDGVDLHLISAICVALLNHAQRSGSIEVVRDIQQRVGAVLTRVHAGAA